MLMVPTYYCPSKLHGIGVFASKPIKKGTLIWEFREGFDFLISEAEANNLPVVALENLKKGSSVWKGYYCVFGDHSRFINHSYTPNLAESVGDDTAYAAVDIAMNEELTEDYRKWLTVAQWNFYFPYGVL